MPLFLLALFPVRDFLFLQDKHLEWLHVLSGAGAAQHEEVLHGRIMETVLS